MFLIFLSASLHAQDYDRIKNQLSEISRQSDALREQAMPTAMKYGFQSLEMDSLNTEIMKFDVMALEKVVAIIENHGWLGISQIGDANQTLFLVIQHAPDPKWRARFFPLLKESAEKGESSLSAMATMLDRMLVEKGEAQVYGTQFYKDGNEFRPFPIQDTARVNELRKGVGLEVLESD